MFVNKRKSLDKANNNSLLHKYKNPSDKNNLWKVHGIRVNKYFKRTNKTLSYKKKH